jgi:putative heme-binding domain-containing protein
VPQLRDLVLESEEDVHSLRGLWALYGVGAFDEAFAGKCLEHKSPWVRSWAIRLLGESGQVSGKILSRWVEMAGKDAAPEVRLQLASTAQKLAKQDTLPLLHRLMKHKEDARDPCLPLMIWLAYEPRVLGNRPAVLAWLKDHAAGNPLVMDRILPNAIRRLVDGDRREDLAGCVAFLGQAPDSSVRRQALASMVQALEGKIKDPPAGWKQIAAGLAKDKDAEVQRLARRLAVNFHDLAALRRSLAIARNTARRIKERLDAIRDVALVHPPEAFPVFCALLARDKRQRVRLEACRALASYARPDVPKFVLVGWRTYSPDLRIEAVNLLAGRRAWAGELLTAVGKNQVPRTDLTNNTILRILDFHDGNLNNQIEKVWGRTRKTPAELTVLINKMRGQLYEGRASFERGRKVFENQCAKCHKFERKGHEVGPALDGGGRDIEYLLINILDPNRVVGQPYLLRRVELLDGRAETGLLAAEDEQSITLKTENDVLKKIQKKDIDGKVQVLEKSVMPEGLNNSMSVQDFRDLIRYLMANPYFTEVSIAGPYNAKEAKTIDLKDPLSSKGLKWTRPVVGVPGRIPLPPARGNAQSLTYVAAEVTAPKGMGTKLQVSGYAAILVWLNGKLVLESHAGTGLAALVQESVNINLNAGINKLLFKVTYKGEKEAMYARLLDPQRRLKYPEPGSIAKDRSSTGKQR